MQSARCVQYKADNGLLKSAFIPFAFIFKQFVFDKVHKKNRTEYGAAIVLIFSWSRMSLEVPLC